MHLKILPNFTPQKPPKRPPQGSPKASQNHQKSQTILKKSASVFRGWFLLICPVFWSIFGGSKPQKSMFFLSKTTIFQESPFSKSRRKVAPKSSVLGSKIHPKSARRLKKWPPKTRLKIINFFGRFFGDFGALKALLSKKLKRLFGPIFGTFSLFVSTVPVWEFGEPKSSKKWQF